MSLISKLPRLGLLAWLLIGTALSAGCVYLPPITGVAPSHAYAPDPNSRLAQALRTSIIDPPRITLVDNAHAALTTRLDLIDAADQSLDLQYFIWQNDPSGILVIRKLLAAADRGVRIRALLDDVQMEGLVPRLIALNQHPNIEIRIFNPFSVRWRYRLWLFRLAEFAIDGNRLNHRMHNKLLVADNQMAILGGRNIGDDYFGRSTVRNFVDLDILVDGPLVPELTQGFDLYWNSRWAYPVNALLNLAVIPDDLDRLARRIDQRLADYPDLQALEQHTRFQRSIDLHAHGAPLRDSTILVDDPSVKWFDNPDEVASQLRRIARRAEHEIIVVTPYLIPTARLFSLAQELGERGVKIKALTNSLQTNDVVIAHSAYANFRRPLLQRGIELYEIRGDAAFNRNDIAASFSLHQKYILIDNRYVFIGSVNLDPRSLKLNTELGLLLDSPPVVQALKASFAKMIQPDNAWQIHLDENNRITWTSSAETRHNTPAKNLWQRLRYSVMKLLPVSNQL